jgi:hypothetical protein
MIEEDLEQMIDELQEALVHENDVDHIIYEYNLDIDELNSALTMVINLGLGEVYEILMAELDEQRMNRNAARRRSGPIYSPRTSIYSPRTPREPLNMNTRVCHIKCPICQQDSSDSSEPFIELPCKHIFHRDCITNWAGSSQNSRTRASCPLCRQMFFGKKR